MADEKVSLGSLLNENPAKVKLGDLLGESEKKKDSSPVSTTPVSQPATPSTTNGVDNLNYNWSTNPPPTQSVIASKETTTEPTVSLMPSKPQTFKNIATGLKEKHDAFLNADLAKSDIATIQTNPKVNQLSVLAKQLADAPKDSPQYNETLAKYNDLLKQPAEDKSPNDWQGGTDLLKDKTVGEATDILKQKVADYNANSEKYKNTSDAINSDVETLRKGDNFKVGAKGYKELGIVDNFVHSYNEGIGNMITGAEWAASDNEGRKQIAQRKAIEEQMVFPQQPEEGGKVYTGAQYLSGLLGGVAPIITGGLATGGTVGALLANTIMMGAGGVGSGGVNAYNQAKKEGKTDDEAMQIANTMSKTEGAIQGALGAGTMFMGSEINASGITDYLKQTVLKNLPITGAFVGGQYLTNKIKQAQGLNTKDSEGLMQNGAMGMTLGLVFDMVHNAPHLLSEKNLNAAQTILGKYALAPTSDAMTKAVTAGITDYASAEKTMQPIRQKAAELAGTPNNMTPEQVVELAPIYGEIKQQLNTIKEAPAEADKIEAQGKVDELNRKLLEKKGIPLTIDEQKSMEKIIAKRDKTDADGKKTPLEDSEKADLKHYEKRIKVADKIAEKQAIEEEKAKQEEEKAKAEKANTPQAGSVGVGDVEAQKVIDNATYTPRHKNGAIVRLPIDLVLENQDPNYAVERGKNEIGSRIDKAKKFLESNPKDLEASDIYIKDSGKDKGKISFGDGRHRLIAAKELGATHAYFELPATKEQFDALNYLLTEFGNDKGIDHTELYSTQGDYKLIQTSDNTFLLNKGNDIYTVKLNESGGFDDAEINKNGKKIKGEPNLLLAVQNHLQDINPESNARNINRFIGRDINKPIPTLDKVSKKEQKKIDADLEQSLKETTKAGSGVGGGVDNKPKVGDVLFDSKKGEEVTVTKVTKPQKGSALENEPYIIDVKYPDGRKAINMPIGERFKLKVEQSLKETPKAEAGVNEVAPVSELTGKEIEPHKEVKVDVKTVAKELGIPESNYRVYEKIKDTPPEELEKGIRDLYDLADDKVSEMEREIDKTENEVLYNERQLDGEPDKKKIEKLKAKNKELLKKQKELEKEKTKAEKERTGVENFYSKNGDVDVEGVQEMIDRINTRLKTRKGVKLGYDLFPELANIPEFKPIEKELQKHIDDGNTTTKQVEDFGKRTANEVEKSEPIIADIEHLAENPKGATDEELAEAKRKADELIKDSGDKGKEVVGKSVQFPHAGQDTEGKVVSTNKDGSFNVVEKDGTKHIVKPEDATIQKTPDELFNEGWNDVKDAFNNPTGGLALNQKMIDGLIKMGQALIQKGEATINDVIEKLRQHLKDNNIFNEKVTEKDFDESIKDIEAGLANKSYEELKDKWLGDIAVDKQRALSEAANFQKEIQDATPKNKGESSRDWEKRWKKTDMAMHVYLDLKRNPEHLKEFYDKLSTGQKEIVDIAQNLTPEQKAIADKIGEEYKKVGEQAKDAGLIKDILDNYVARSWDIEGKSATEVNRKFGTSTKHSLQRTLDTILEGWAKGLNLKVKGATNNLATLKQEIAQVIQNKALIERGSRTEVNENGDKLFVTHQQDGYSKVENPSFKKWNYTGDVKGQDDSQLMGKRKDILVTKDGTVLQKQDVYAPDQVAKNLNNILGESKLKGYAPLDAVRKFNNAVKQTILTTSLFHHLAFTRNKFLTGAFNNIGDLSPKQTYESGLADIRQMTPEVEILVRNGLTLGKIQDWDESVSHEKGVIGKKLDAMGVLPDVRERISDAIANQKRFLFDEFGAGMKAFDGINMFKNLMKKNPTADPNENAKIVANAMNNNYGGLNLQRIGRNPTTQDIAHLLLLAPDWTESNLRMAANAFKRGDEGDFNRRMWAKVFLRGASAVALTNLAMAMIPDPNDKSKNAIQNMKDRYKRAWDEGHLNWMKINISPLAHEFGAPKDKDYYFSLFGHYSDPLRLASSMIDPQGGSGIKFFTNKGSVVTKLAGQAVTAQDWKGQQYTTLEELLGIDDKGKYAKTIGSHKKGAYSPTTMTPYKKDQKGHTAGAEKGGKLKGELTKFSIDPAHPINIQQAPSYTLDQIRGMMPTQIQNMWQYASGEQDGFTTIGNSIGLGITRTSPPKKK